MKYLAYGSNLNLKQMAYRCPTAKVVGTAMLKDYQLTFQSVATIIPKQGAMTPVGIWEIDQICEKALDRYEGYPTLYRKEYVKVEYKGEELECLIYIMNNHRPSLPSINYYESIMDGYNDVGLDESFLVQALEYTEGRIKNSKE